MNTNRAHWRDENQPPTFEKYIIKLKYLTHSIKSKTMKITEENLSQI